MYSVILNNFEGSTEQLIKNKKKVLLFRGNIDGRK